MIMLNQITTSGNFVQEMKVRIKFIELRPNKGKVIVTIKVVQLPLWFS